MTVKTPNVTEDSEWLPFDPRTVYRFLYREKWVICGIAITIAASVIGWAARLPKLYEGNVVLEYDPDPPRPLRRDLEDVADGPTAGWAGQEWIRTQNLIIRSRTLAERVVRRLGLNQDPQFMGVDKEDLRKWKGATVEEAALRLLEDLKVEQKPETRLVQLRYRNSDPRKSQAVANAIADAYVEKTLQDRLGATVEALSWLNSQLSSLKNELGDAELSLHGFKQEHNIVSFSLKDSQNVIAAKMQQFNQALNSARTRRIELSAKLTQLETFSHEDPLHAHLGDLETSSRIPEIRSLYRQKLAERDALAIKYGRNHPSMQSLDAELSALSSYLTDEAQGLVMGARRSLAAAEQTEHELNRALQEVQRAGLDLNLKEIEYNRLERAKENSEKLHGLLLERATEANLTKLLRVSHVRILDPALLPRVHVSPRLWLISGVAVLVGIFLGFVFALIHDRLDRTVRSVEAAEALGVTVLGILPSIGGDDSERSGRARAKRRGAIPAVRDLVVHTNPRSAVAECCRSVRTNLTFLATDKPVKSLVVTSAGPREGKTTVAVSLAISIAQSGKRVLLVDTDLRLPRLHRTFSLQGTEGITSVLIGDVPLEQAIRTTAIPNLSILPCGPIPPNPAEIVQGGRFKSVLRDLESEFDLVVLDSPPLGPVIDAAIISLEASGALVVINARRTRKETVATALRQLRDVNVRVLGAVINDVDIFAHNSGYGGYYYYYRPKARGGDSPPPPDDAVPTTAGLSS